MLRGARAFVGARLPPPAHARAALHESHVHVAAAHLLRVPLRAVIPAFFHNLTVVDLLEIILLTSRMKSQKYL